jgi:6-phosphogluconate dehydrogenase
LTIGGKKETYSELSKLFNTLSTPESPNGLYVGVAGAGHYVKMIHNGIEYGMMQSIAEGFEILKKKEEFNLNLYEISQNWRSGSVIQSWLIDLITYELKNDTNLSKFSSMVSDSGEGRWTIKESIDLSVPIPSIYASISQRFNSKNKDSFSGKILSAMRNAFGGHKD